MFDDAVSEVFSFLETKPVWSEITEWIDNHTTWENGIREEREIGWGVRGSGDGYLSFFCVKKADARTFDEGYDLSMRGGGDYEGLHISIPVENGALFGLSSRGPNLGDKADLMKKEMAKKNGYMDIYALFD